MHPHIHQKIFSEPWLIEPAYYDAIRSTYLAHCGIAATIDGRQVGPKAKQDPKSFFDSEPASKDRKPYQVQGATAIVPMFGILGKQLSALEMLCGGADIDSVVSAVEQAYADPSVQTVVLNVNSPGGTVTGGPEAAARIAALADRGEKEIVSYTETTNASLAYYISSQAHRVFASPSSRTGSIGTVATYVDQTAYDAELGVKYITFKSGKFKDTGNPHRQLTQEELDLIQGEIASINAGFIQAVATARDLAPETVESLEAGIYRAPQAQAHGLIDGQHDTLADLLATLR